jgi:hypothetical protein
MKIETIFTEKWLEHFVKVVNDDQEFSWIAKHMNTSFVWKIGDAMHLFIVQNGRLLEIQQPIWNESWDFSVEGPTEVWAKFILPEPPPVHNDILGIVNHLPNCYLNGNRIIAMQNIRALMHLFSLSRKVGDM